MVRSLMRRGASRDALSSWQNGEVTGRSKFAGGDQKYLRDVQYLDSANLTARANLHAKYGTGSMAWFPWLASQIDWPSSGDVLEVGCGPGWLWAEAAEDLPAGLHLTLTDLSAGMTEAASARVGALGRFATVRTEVVDAQRLPFPDGAFDVVIANHMLYHVPKPALAVSELARVLRPNGCLLAAANGPANMKELWQLRSEVFDLPLVSTTADATTDAFGSVTGVPILRARFARVEWRTYVDELRCTDPNDVVAHITSSPPGEDASPEQLTALDRAVRAHFATADGVFNVGKDTGAFVAVGPHQR